MTPIPDSKLVTSIHQARKRKVAGLTEVERQLLLQEVAAISAELSNLQMWAAEISRRVANSSITRADRSA